MFNDIEGWLGEYEYYEFISPNTSLHMHIKVFKQEKNYYAEIDINGFNINEKLISSVKGDKDKIEFLFLSNKECSEISYNKDDLLLTFVKDNDSIITNWGGIEPFNSEKFVYGKERFVKIENESDLPLSGNIDSWIGKYMYNEFCPPDVNLNMEIEIYKHNNVYLSRININGFQVYEDIVAKVHGDKNQVDFMYLKSNIDKPHSYEHGAILLRFRLDDSFMLTDWGEIKPYIIENQSSGNVRFEKITN